MKEGASTASYCVVLEESGEVHCGIGDLEINQYLTVDWVFKLVHGLCFTKSRYL